MFIVSIVITNPFVMSKGLLGASYSFSVCNAYLFNLKLLNLYQGKKMERKALMPLNSQHTWVICALW